MTKTDTIIFVISMTAIVAMLASIVYAAATGQVDIHNW